MKHRSNKLPQAELMAIEVQIDELLKARNRTFYWLSKQTGVSHTTLWRLKKGKALGVNFITLERICYALDCQPGDLLRLGRKQMETGPKQRDNG